MLGQFDISTNLWYPGLMQEWLTVEELAALADVEGSHVRRLLGRGLIPGATKKAGAWFVPVDQGRAWAHAMATLQAARRAAGKVPGRPRKRF
jgi:hypothetical protein